MIEEVTDRKISQFREGSFGRLSNQEAGIPVYCKAVLNPESLLGSIGADGGVVAFWALIPDGG